MTILVGNPIQVVTPLSESRTSLIIEIRQTLILSPTNFIKLFVTVKESDHNQMKYRWFVDQRMKCKRRIDPCQWAAIKDIVEKIP